MFHGFLPLVGYQREDEIDQSSPAFFERPEEAAVLAVLDGNGRICHLCTVHLGLI